MKKLIKFLCSLLIASTITIGSVILYMSINVNITNNFYIMALRIRETGEILCAAHTLAEKGDTYLDDDIHYKLSVITGAIIASPNHKEDNRWFWNNQRLT
jgi:hypothetical protein